MAANPAASSKRMIILEVKPTGAKVQTGAGDYQIVNCHPQLPQRGLTALETTAHIRRLFRRELVRTLGVVWPILSALLIIIAGLGMLVAHLEGWGLLDGIYFAFVTGLTVGYGDLVLHGLLPRLLAIAIGFSGILLTALVAAIAVRAMQAATEPR